ncbi:MAG: hypothetical protein KatS3mg104_3048 [Phycisphaerae bacterium]|nr:MAG: hypothetical protein KatS3mg104_3048 [Phycisphaerae bacterium]
MPTVIWDTLPNAMLEALEPENFRSNRRLVRPGIVYDLVSVDHEDILTEALNVLTAQQDYGDPHPGDLTLELVKYEIVPVGNKVVNFRAIYESRLNTALIPSAWMIEDSTTLVTREENITVGNSAGTSTLIKVDYNPSLSSAGTQKTEIHDVGTIRVSRPSRVIRLTVNTRKRPTNIPYDIVGKVNDSNFLGADKGAWLITELSGRTTTTQEYVVTAVFTQAPLTYDSSNTDWREFVIGYYPPTGRYLQISDSEMNTARTTPYKHGIIYKGNGITVVGPYATTNFAAYFGV